MFSFELDTTDPYSSSSRSSLLLAKLGLVVGVSRVVSLWGFSRLVCAWPLFPASRPRSNPAFVSPPFPPRLKRKRPQQQQQFPTCLGGSRTTANFESMASCSHGSYSKRGSGASSMACEERGGRPGRESVNQKEFRNPSCWRAARLGTFSSAPTAKPSWAISAFPHSTGDGSRRAIYMRKPRGTGRVWVIHVPKDCLAQNRSQALTKPTPSSVPRVASPGWPRRQPR